MEDFKIEVEFSTRGAGVYFFLGSMASCPQFPLPGTTLFLPWEAH